MGKKRLEKLKDLFQKKEEEFSMDQFRERQQIAASSNFTFKPSTFHPTVDQKLYTDLDSGSVR